jgi:hypothetical protein
MEPMNATAYVTSYGCEVWAPTQGQELAQLMVAQLLGMPPDKIKINRTFLGGGFGRRLVADFVLQAVAASKAVGRPVKIVWSREEDIQHDIYRPAVRNRITVGLDSDAKIAAVSHQVVSPSILHYVSPMSVQDNYDPSCVEGLHGTRCRSDGAKPPGFRGSLIASASHFPPLGLNTSISNPFSVSTRYG